MPFSYSYPHPAVTVDVAVFTVREDRLEVLLVKRGSAPYQGEWALPGGFVGLEESLQHAAWRELREETGVKAMYLEQLYSFGHPDRDPRERVISVAYLAVIPSDRLALRAASDAEEVGWFAIGDTPALAFDHDTILARALQRLRAKIDYSTLALQFMPENFSLPELQRVYEIVSERQVDRRNFRKRILALDVIEPTGEKMRGGAHRPARAYRVIDRKKVGVIK